RMAQSTGIHGASLDAARDTLGAALAIAEKLPGPHGAALARAAREAFAASLRLTSAIVAVLMMGLAILAALSLRRANPTPTLSSSVDGDNMALRATELPCG